MSRRKKAREAAWPKKRLPQPRQPANRRSEVDAAGQRREPLPEEAARKAVATRATSGPDRAASRATTKAFRMSLKLRRRASKSWSNEGQYFEAEVVDGVENAPLADEAEVTIHERPETRERKHSRGRKAGREADRRRVGRSVGWLRSRETG